MRKLTCTFAVALILCQFALAMPNELNKPQIGRRSLEETITDWKNSVLSEVKKAKDSVHGLFQSSGFKSGIEKSRHKLEDLFINLFGNKTVHELGAVKQKMRAAPQNFGNNGGALQVFASGIKRAKQKIEEEFQKSINEGDAGNAAVAKK